MTNIVIATCARLMDLKSSEALLKRALEARGAQVTVAQWDGDFAPFAAADLTLVRSVWDYCDKGDAFAAWIDRLEAEARVMNPAPTLRFSMTKAYLLELAAQGAPVAPTKRVVPSGEAILAAADELGISDVIVKPVIGASAEGLSRFAAGDADAAAKAASILGGDGLVTAFIPEIQTLGETSLIFIGEQFSHAVRKTPKPGDIRIQEEHGGVSELVDPPAWAVGEARGLLELCPGALGYARVDVILYENHLRLMEIELVEPELFFPLFPQGAERLADHVLADF